MVFPLLLTSGKFWSEGQNFGLVEIKGYYVKEYIKGAEKFGKKIKNLFLPPMRHIHPGTQVQF